MIHEMVFDPTELRTVGTVFDEAWESLRTQHEAAMSLPSYVSGSRLWCFGWQGIVSSAKSRSQRPLFGMLTTTTRC